MAKEMVVIQTIPYNESQKDRSLYLSPLTDIKIASKVSKFPNIYIHMLLMQEPLWNIGKGEQRGLNKSIRTAKIVSQKKTSLWHTGLDAPHSDSNTLRTRFNTESQKMWQ